MDLIVELVIWIFKALTGEKSPGNRTPTKGANPQTPVQRGPYNYGDGRPAAGKTRTLEEILEEVKRQQAQNKPGAQRPATPRAAAAPPLVTMPKAKVPSLSRPLSEVQTGNEVRPATTPMTSAKGGAIQSTLETRMLKQTLDQVEGIKPGFDKKFEKISERESQQAIGIGRTKMVAEVNTVTTMGEVQSVDTMDSSLSGKRTNKYAEFFKSMRSAKPVTRAEMARQAFVYSEVFGPPRSRRRIR